MGSSGGGQLRGWAALGVGSSGGGQLWARQLLQAASPGCSVSCGLCQPQGSVPGTGTLRAGTLCPRSSPKRGWEQQPRQRGCARRGDPGGHGRPVLKFHALTEKPPGRIPDRGDSSPTGSDDFVSPVNTPQFSGVPVLGPATRPGVTGLS